VPLWLVVAVVRARADAGTARVRVRVPGGPWLVCHASCLRGAHGSFGGTAVVIEPAPPSEVGPIVVEAYDLSEREQEITALVARGLDTGAMADALRLSPHTVRDHVKAVFRKAGVSSRGELVAKLFAEHYELSHRRDVLRVGTDGAAT
jgi:DNA-binding CsgD family transcriptional regulator